MLGVAPPTERVGLARDARWLASLVLIAAVGSTSLALALAVYRGAWQHYADAVAFGLTLIAALVSLRWIRHERYEAAAWLMIASLTWAVWTLTAVMVGVGAVTGAGLAASTTVIAGQLLPRKRRLRGILAGVGAGVIAIIYEFYGPMDRLPAEPLVQLFAVTLVVGVVAAYGAISVPRFPHYSLRTKLVIGFLVVALTPLILLAYLNDLTTRAILTSNANQALTSAASQTAASVDSFIAANLASIRIEAQLPEWSEYLSRPVDRRAGTELEAEVKGTLNALASKHWGITSYALLDEKGQDVLDTFTPDIGLDKSDRDYFKNSFMTGRVYVSPVEFSPTAGEASLYFSSPVRNPGGSIVGVLRLRYSARVLQDLIAQSTGLAGKGSFAELLDEHHIHLADGGEEELEPETLFKSVAPLDPALVSRLQAERRLPPGSPADLTNNLPELEQALRRRADQPFFTTREEATGDRLNQATAAELETQPWLVVFFQPRDVFLAPLEAQTRLTLTLVLVVAAGLVAAATATSQLLAGPITRLTLAAEQVAAGDLTAQARAETTDEIGTLASTFNLMVSRLRETLTGLEARVAERTAELHYRATQLQTSAEVARAIAATLDLQQLLPQVTQLISDRFGFYHVGIFLIDETGEYAVLQAANSEGGQRMLARRHKLRVGQVGIVGYVTGTGQPRIALDVGRDAVYFDNPDLPATRSEMALPLKVHGKVIGALDVQSTQPQAFTEEDVALLSTLADQVAIAIENARSFEAQVQLAEENLRLLERSERAREELDALTRRLTREGWQMFLQERGEAMLAVDAAPETSRPTADVPELALAADRLQPVIEVDDKRSTVALPIVLRGEGLGAVALEDYTERAWSQEDIALLENVAEHVALALDNARLLEETAAAQRQAEARAEQLASVNRVATSVSTILELEEMLRAASREIVQIFRARNCGIALLSPDRERLTVMADSSANPDEPNAVGIVIPVKGNPSSEYVLDTGRPLVIPDAQHHPLTAPIHDLMRARRTECLMILPLRARGEIIGTIGIDATEPGRVFTETEVALAETIAGQIAGAVDNARLFQTAQRRALQLATAAEIARDTSSTLALDSLLKRAVELVRERFGFYHASLFLLDDAEAYAVVRESTGEAGAEMKRRGHKLAVGSQSIIGAVTATGQPLVVNDVSQNPTHRPNPLLPDTRAELGIPLKIGQRVIGALDVQSTQVGAFTPDDVAVLQTLADQIAVAADNARLFDEINKRLTEQQWLHQITTAAASAPTVESMLAGVVESVRQAMRGALVSILLVEEDRQTLRVHAAAGYDRDLAGLSLRMGQGVTGWTALTGEPARIGDVRAAPRYVEGQPGVASELAVPLKLGKQVIGVINVESSVADAFSEHDERLLETLANTLAAIISNAQHFEAEQRERRIALILATAAARMAETLSEADLRRLLISEIYEYLHPDRIALYDWNGEEGKFVLNQRLGGWAEGEPRNPGDAIPAGDRPDWIKPLREQQASWEVRELANGTRRACYVLPWAIGETAAGVLEIVYPTTANNLLPEDQLLCEGLVDQAASALRLARLYAEQREAAERLAEVDKLKSQFLANMSHELRTPLNSIIGFSRVILKGIDGPITDLQQQDLNAIYHSGQHLLGLINDILDLSKIEAGKMELTFDEVDLSELITSVMSTAVGLVKGKPIRLVRDIAPHLPPVRADAARIRQVMLNLLSNAAKFTDQGEVTVRAWLETSMAGSPPMVVVSVHDTGIGIAPADQAKLFEPFSQVDASPTRKTGGTGLGLAISRHFIEAHGGRMWVESQVGRGSAFYFSLPLAQAPQPGELPPGTDGRLVLAVDDNADLISLYQRYLAPGGYRVAGLTDSTLALETARRLKPYAILLDVFMQNKDGWQVMEELRADQEARRIPVIVCTISTERQRGLDLGAADFLIKPILEEDLLKALDRLDKGRASETAAAQAQAS